MREAQVILLPHPGRECPPNRGAFCDWPSADAAHARKFMCAEGTWRNLAGGHGTDRVVFWAEYEAPTHTKALISTERRSGLPQYVHEIERHVSGPTLNTDPWVPSRTRLLGIDGAILFAHNPENPGDFVCGSAPQAPNRTSTANGPPPATGRLR